MTPERWQSIEAAFHHAASLTSEERLVYLKQLDADTRNEVRSLLEAEDIPLTLSSEILATINDLKQSDPRNNQRLGPYRILGELGSGGMGSVFKATRDDDAFQKVVAIKIIRANLANTQFEQRFRSERQILAQLEHPYIARLIDGGTHEGLPYIVMEFIEGQPIDAYVRLRKLSTRELLILFRKVCEAVQHAHQRLIVHRDLKPGNIIVLPDGTPRLLDFGIAKLLDQPEDSLHTQTGWLLMTPDYASPEQVMGEPITVASDVYSLAIILYELLTGERPYKLKNYSPSELQRTICTGIIPSPKVASDLDNILLKALRLEPSRRYPSVEKFSDDIRRYLDGETVSARPDTFFYRSTKFIQRHRLPVTLAAVLLISILTGAALVYREGLRAQHRFTQVRSIANRVLTEFDTEASKLPGNTRLRSIMVRASMEYLDSLAAESTADPNLQLEVAFAYAKVGDTLGYPRTANLNQPFEAAIAYNKAISLCESNRNHSKSRNLLAYLYAHYAALLPYIGKPEQATSYHKRALALIDFADASTSFEVRYSFVHHLLIQGELDQAAAILAPAFQSSGSAQAQMNLRHLASQVEASRGNLQAAIAHLDQALAVSKAAGRPSLGLERTAALLLLDRARLTYTRNQPSLWQPCASLPYAREAAGIAMKLVRLDPANRPSTIQAVDFTQVYSQAQTACSPKSPSTADEDTLFLYNRLKLQPESAHANQALRLLALGNPTAALQLLAPYRNQKSSQLNTMRTLAEIYLQLNRAADAIAILQPALADALKASHLQTQDAILYRERSLPISLMLGDAYSQLNQQNRAREIWQAALTRVPSVAGKFPPAPSTLHWQRELQSRLK